MGRGKLKDKQEELKEPRRVQREQSEIVESKGKTLQSTGDRQRGWQIAEKKSACHSRFRCCARENITKQINQRALKKSAVFIKQAKDFAGNALKKAYVGQRCVAQRRVSVRCKMSNLCQ